MIPSHNEPAAPKPDETNVLVTIYRALLRIRWHRAHHPALICLSHDEARVLRQIGIDPFDVTGALRRRRWPLSLLGRKSGD